MCVSFRTISSAPYITGYSPTPHDKKISVWRYASIQNIRQGSDFIDGGEDNALKNISPKFVPPR